MVYTRPVHPIGRWLGASAFRVALGLMTLLTWPGVSLAQLDICGCTGHPQNRGAFDASNTATYPPGTTRSGGILTVLLPHDGILMFSSFTAPPGFFVFFRHQLANDPANAPATILVSGDVTITGVVDVNGLDGSGGTSGLNGVGGLGGPGGFPGGDGAYPQVNFSNNGGPGVGPGGGAGGTASPLTVGRPATFLGTRELLPLVGGAGGGGGASNRDDCSAGGGGGGGGALLIAANGTLTINGTIRAEGGFNGFPNNPTCAAAGGSGSGGAIRLLANTMTGNGSIFARGGNFLAPQAGAIRLEAFTNTLSANNTTPVASRAPAPGPLVNPLTPTVEITQVGGQTVPTPPQGAFRGIDVILPAPGPITVRLATSGVPGGTAVHIIVKPRVGGAALTTPVTLVNCTVAGDCAETVVVNLASGAHVIEAQATFQP